MDADSHAIDQVAIHLNVLQSFPGAKSLIGRFAVGLLVTAAAIAQAQPFASVEVKVARSSALDSRRVRVLANGDLIATSVNPISLISDGYDVPGNPSRRLSGLPPWVYGERYDIVAKALPSAKPIVSSGSNASELVRAIFRQVLAQQFHLVMQTEKKSMPVYALVVARGGPKLKEPKPSECIFDTAPDGCHSFLIGFGHPLNARAVDMNDLARYIENWTDLPVVNETSLTGVFTMSTDGWQPMNLPPPPSNATGNVDFTHLQTIDSALSGLGLGLRRQDAVVPIYTVQHIERPSTE